MEGRGKGNFKGMWGHSDPALVSEKTIHSLPKLQLRKADIEYKNWHKNSKFYLNREEGGGLQDLLQKSNTSSKKQVIQGVQDKH